jgi:ubiquinone/menaquinone biosynthesis C-methylase UbiE
MSEQRQSWQDKESAQHYAKQAGIRAKIVYAPFAKKIVGSVPPLEQGATIIELGIGPGLLAIELSKLCPQAQIIGLDPSEEMLRIARKNAEAAGASGLEVRPGTAENIPLESGSADLVVSQSSLHEWENLQQGIAEIFRVLKPGGSVILEDYNRGWFSPWKRRLVGLLHPLHMFKFTFEEVAALLREAGFEQAEGQGSGLEFVVSGLKH